MVMWLQGTEDETEPAGAAGLFDGLSEAERRAVHSFMRLLNLAPLSNQSPDNFLLLCRELVEFLHQQAG
jgi:hypothetical protein